MWTDDGIRPADVQTTGWRTLGNHSWGSFDSAMRLVEPAASRCASRQVPGILPRRRLELLLDKPGMVVLVEAIPPRYVRQ